MNNELREKIINYNKHDFMNFLENDYSGQILELFNDYGISLLKNYTYLKERISYILNFSKYKDILLSNNDFLDLLLNSDISYYYAVLENLKDSTYDLIIKRSIELNKEPYEIAELITYFSHEYQFNLIDNWNLSADILYELLKLSTNYLHLLPKILNKYKIDLLSHNINLENLFDAGKNLYLKSCEDKYVDKQDRKNLGTFYLSKGIINNEVANHLWNKYDVFRYRKILNDAEYCGDISVLNEYSKQREEEFIFSSKYISPFDEIYSETVKLFQIEDGTDEWYNIRENLFNKIRKLDEKEAVDLNKLISNNNINDLKIYLDNYMNKTKSNYIIDYHFDENYYNVMYDLNELLDFYYAGNINIPEDRLSLYQKIAAIDYLTTEEKIELHENLKLHNMKEMFYNDMSFARKIVKNAIKDYSITSEEMKQYKDDKLSKEYGVDVYTINDNPFFAIVKSGRHVADELPTGHSYSLVGNGCIATFDDPENSNTYVYDANDLNPNQIVHVFPKDSFTFYRPFEHSTSPTSRVNTLIMPDELLYNNKSYTELLILEEGTKSLEVNKNLPELQRIALYCVDKISKKDVEIAQEHNIGIFLVNSKNYYKGEDLPNNIFRHKGKVDYNYNYFNGSFEKEEHEKRR